MVFLELNESGVYIKTGGQPLEPRQIVMFRDDIYQLPQHYEEGCGDILIARKWLIATVDGHHTLIEYLPKYERGWPWPCA